MASISNSWLTLLSMRLCCELRMSRKVATPERITTALMRMVTCIRIFDLALPKPAALSCPGIIVPLYAVFRQPIFMLSKPASTKYRFGRKLAHLELKWVILFSCYFWLFCINCG